MRALWLLAVASGAAALRYDPAFEAYNLNSNKSATNPLDYAGSWPGHQYHPSPDNWRFPFYTLMMDRFVNGDPTNDDINGTFFEHDIMGNQLRHGGDVAGLLDTLDYLQGMGIRGIYLAGSIFMNLPWNSDSYNPLDFTVLDQHFATLQQWRDAIQEIHNRGMYVLLDNTVSTMGDLIGFQGYLNTSTPFSLQEHKALWKSERHYPDFNFGNNYLEKCQYPRFWRETGVLLDPTVTSKMVGCYDSEFDQYGDTDAFGDFPDWQRQLAKFQSVQDRLREWQPSVRLKIEHFACMSIKMLDIDGFRLDKATQITVDALGDWAAAMRACAKSVNKTNFFIAGEITGQNTFGTVYLGRGRQSDQYPENSSVALNLATTPEDQRKKYFIRDPDKGALDAAAFHYTVYRHLTQFLGMYGYLVPKFDAPANWVAQWNTYLSTNDFINPNTGKNDPRHLYGVTNQDVFRWPALVDGTKRWLLGAFITTILMPGIPKLLWGEEQEFYILDNTASNYAYGRQGMSATPSWQNHGCYGLGATTFFEFPVGKAKDGCLDEKVSYDHRDPSYPLRSILKAMYQMRQNYPVLNDGMYMEQLSNSTSWPQVGPVANFTTEKGIWSSFRAPYAGYQNLTGALASQVIWLVYTNEQEDKTFHFNCDGPDNWLLAPFKANTVVKNLFYPYDEQSLIKSGAHNVFGDPGSTNGCLDTMSMTAYGFKAYVPKSVWIGPKPMMTKFSPGHDARILSRVPRGMKDTVKIELQYSAVFDCKSFSRFISFRSQTDDGSTPSIDSSSIQCGLVQNPDLPFNVSIPSVWSFSANLVGVASGVHQMTITNATASDNSSTNAVDHLFFRLGQPDNPIVFPRTANYTTGLIGKYANGSMYLSHKASGADMYRYSINWGSTYTPWANYTGMNETLVPLNWTGTKRQAWKGTHVMVQYFNKIVGTSSIIQHSDYDIQTRPRRFPHLFAAGPFNSFGFDEGVRNDITMDQSDGIWKFNFFSEWPAKFQVNTWGMNPDGFPDKSHVLGDIDNDLVLDRMPPSSLADTSVNVSIVPPLPYLSYRFELDDGTYRYRLVPVGSASQQAFLYFLLWLCPLLTAALSVWVFQKLFYAIKFNQRGVQDAQESSGIAGWFKRDKKQDHSEMKLSRLSRMSIFGGAKSRQKKERRTVLIATIEYDIEDWKIKVKIGGLGVMAQLMSRNLGHQDLIWVVPCVGDVKYPFETAAEPLTVRVVGKEYQIQVYHHVLRNITYVLLDAPVFRRQSTEEPYPPRMDDLDSAIFYSAWNQCIAGVIKRFDIDIYHVNDFHGALGPLYLLPDTIPCCLSLHNAEFQGLWRMRTPEEWREVCAVYNLDPEIVKKYVQFGDVFSLLHAGASYLRIHQKGFGAVGVSKKYGKRSLARYPIFWGLKKIGNLPNPDPADTAEWKPGMQSEAAVVDARAEKERGATRMEAQEWAGLKKSAHADLMVFVGRWSVQKGIDLIADIMPSILEEYPNVQLLCVGPVIDLYGKFAAMKLDVLVKKYPGRVVSKPVFTALPPCVFAGAEFALIPSRDEPFGLVAVEFGRKGALGIGALVGGLGQMPGWWYTVESTTAGHLMHQFKMACKEALASDDATRAKMRATSAKQRFPVAEWIEGLETLQKSSIKMHSRQGRSTGAPPVPTFQLNPGSDSSYRDDPDAPPVPGIKVTTYGDEQEGPPTGFLQRSLSLGRRAGPGHYGGDRGGPRQSMFKRARSGVWNIEEEGDDDDDDDDDIISSFIDEYFVTPEQVESGRVADDYKPDYDPHVMDNRLGDFKFAEDMHSPGPRNGFEPPSAYGGYGPPSTYSGYGPPSTHSGYGPPSTRTSGFFSPPTGHDNDFFSPTSGTNSGLATPNPFLSRNASRLSLSSVVEGRRDFGLQKVDPKFIDADGFFSKQFERKLYDLNTKNSESELSIVDFLVKSEKKWFDEIRAARLGIKSSNRSSDDYDDYEYKETDRLIDLPMDETPTGVKLFMLHRVWGWPVYSLTMALGQIISASSYQISLISGDTRQTPIDIYLVAVIYGVASVLWWLMFRKLQSIYVLSVPFFFYGLAFAIIALTPFFDLNGRAAVEKVASCIYAIASSSGSIFFALNFGDEGVSPTKEWILRACAIQGTQQFYSVFLWYWGSSLTKAAAFGADNKPGIGVTVAGIILLVLMWAVCYINFVGLPKYYRQPPGAVPSFYKSVYRRKIILWFFVMVVVQSYLLSTCYGRSWGYLWASNNAPTWAVVILVIFFFVIVWGAALWLLGKMSDMHSWIVPVFAIGLGAPRWCQMLWGASSIGSYLPWAGGPVASALMGRALWLWLTVLDSIQGVGLGMILLQTLTRIHIAFTLVAAQVLGATFTILAKLSAPNKNGPGDVFPDFAAGAADPLSKAWFWVTMVCQLGICVGFFMFFRDEQLAKP